MIGKNEKKLKINIPLNWDNISFQIFIPKLDVYILVAHLLIRPNPSYK